MKTTSSGPLDLHDLEGVDQFVEGVEFCPELHRVGPLRFRDGVGESDLPDLGIIVVAGDCTSASSGLSFEF